MTEVVVLADDVTGAADTAAAFAGAGMTASVVTDDPDAGGPGAGAGVVDIAALRSDVVAFDLGSRDADPATAAARARGGTRRALSLSPGQLYKKVDSTLRGHVGVEVGETIAAMAEGTSRAVLTIVSVAFPEVGRTVRRGVVRVGSASGGGSDDAVAWHGSVVAALGPLGHRAGLIGHAEVRRGAEHVAELLAGRLDRGIDVVVLDAELSEDLRTAAAAGTIFARRRPDVAILWVASGGLARHLPVSPGAGARTPASEGLRVGGGAIVAVIGSATPVARAQHAALAAQARVTAFDVDPAAVDVDADLAIEVDGPARRSLRRDVDRALLRGDLSLALVDTGPASEQLRAEPSHLLAGLVASAAAPIAALMTTGGRTTAAVFRARGIGAVSVVGELEPGVVACHPIGAPEVLLVTKAGGFGDAETLVRCRDRVIAARRAHE